jgi:hypothetical protein
MQPTKGDQPMMDQQTGSIKTLDGQYPRYRLAAGE